jgi:hypothetical protein
MNWYWDWKRDLMNDVLLPVAYEENGHKTIEGKNSGVGLAAFKLGIKEFLFSPKVKNDLWYVHGERAKRARRRCERKEEPEKCSWARELGEGASAKKS